MGRIFTVPPSPWEVGHAAGIALGERYLAEHGTLPDTPMWRMLESRHDLNPARFDHWHPNLGRLIEGLPLNPPAAVESLGWTGCMRGGETLAVVTVAETPAVAATPEPSSLVLWCVGLAMVYFVVGVWNYRRVLTQTRDVIDWILERSEAR